MVPRLMAEILRPDVPKGRWGKQRFCIKADYKGQVCILQVNPRVFIYGIMAALLLSQGKDATDPSSVYRLIAWNPKSHSGAYRRA